jgi:hypothetical protein
MQFMLIAKAKSADLRYACTIAVIGLLLALPAVLYGAFDAMDLPFHLKWSKHFAEQVWDGDLYPRWLQDMNAGLGSPTFFFYAPVPYYFSSLLHPLFANDPQSWHQLGWSVAIALVASGFTAYLWLKSFTDRTTALMGSILYMALPYHLGVNLYWRFALAEYWALVWLPLILYFSRKLIHQLRFNFVGTAVSFALLIMTHLPTLVMFATVPVVYVFVLANQAQRWKALLRLVLAMLLGIGLAAIYWFPAMTTQEFISMNAILEKGYFYGNNFLFSRQASLYHNGNFWIYLEVLVVSMLGLAGCAFIFMRGRLPTALNREGNFWFSVAAITFLLMLPISKLIWDVLPPLQRIQFPWRLNTVLLIAVTALLTLAIYTLRHSIGTQRKAILTIGLVLTISLLLSNIIVVKQRLKPRPNYDVAAALAMSMEEAFEYRPRWVAPDVFQAETLQKISQRFSQLWMAEGQGSASILQWQPRQIVLQSNFPDDTWLTLKQFYYSGWQAELAETSRELPVRPSQREGLLQVELPGGNQTVKLRLTAGLEERIGQILSAIAVLLAGLLSFTFKRHSSVQLMLRKQNRNPRNLDFLSKSGKL